MPAQQVGQVERDGFKGTVYEGAKGRFVAWNLATLSAAQGREVAITGVTGENGSPKAAAYNLQHNERNGFLMRVLRSRVQLGRGEGGGIEVTVPGAAIQGAAYDEPMAITLRAQVNGTKDVPVALSLFADQIAGMAARGVYAAYAAEEQDEEEDLPEEAVEVVF